MTMTDTDRLSGPDLVRLYNERVVYARSIGVENVRETARFESASAAKKRIDMLESAIRAREASNRAVEAESAVEAIEEAAESAVEAIEEAAESAVEAIEEAETATESSVSAQATTKKRGRKADTTKARRAPTKARRATPRKAARATTTKARGRAAVATNGGGLTGRAITDEWNLLVPSAQKLGIKVKIHTSLFETLEYGMSRLAWLKDQIAERS